MNPQLKHHAMGFEAVQGNYVIVTRSEVGNYVIADTLAAGRAE
jgi:hypothetical protein